MRRQQLLKMRPLKKTSAGEHASRKSLCIRLIKQRRPGKRAALLALRQEDHEEEELLLL